MWRHPRLSSGSSFHPPLNPVGIPSGGSPSSIKPEAAGAVRWWQLPLSFPFPPFLPLPRLFSLPRLSDVAPIHPVPNLLFRCLRLPSSREGSPAPLPPGARLLGIPRLLRETQRHRESEPTCTCFSCCFRKPLWLLPPTSPAFIYSLSCSRWGFFLSFFPSPRRS